MKDSKPGGAAIEWGPMKPVSSSLVGPFEAYYGKPVNTLTEAEILVASREYLAAAFGRENEMTPHLDADTADLFITEPVPAQIRRCDCNGACGKGRCRMRGGTL